MQYFLTFWTLIFLADWVQTQEQNSEALELVPVTSFYTSDIKQKFSSSLSYSLPVPCIQCQANCNTIEITKILHDLKSYNQDQDYQKINYFNRGCGTIFGPGNNQKVYHLMPCFFNMVQCCEPKQHDSVLNKFVQDFCVRQTARECDGNPEFVYEKTCVFVKNLCRRLLARTETDFHMRRRVFSENRGQFWNHIKGKFLRLLSGHRPNRVINLGGLSA